MSAGWIKLHRSLVEHWVHEDPFVFRAWCDLLLLANHKDSKIFFCGEALEIKKGQRLTSIRKLALLWNCDPKTAKKILTTFEQDGMIKTQNMRYHGTLITIDNYSVYQAEKEERWRAVSTADSPTDSPAVSLAPSLTASLQTRMNKNDKNDKERKKTASGGGIFGGEWE